MDIYDEIADMFMSSLAAEVAGVSRAELMEHLRAKWPTEYEARQGFAEIKARATTTVNELQREAAKRRKVVIGIAYPVKKDDVR
jgi:hypothetical protein